MKKFLFFYFLFSLFYLRALPTCSAEQISILKSDLKKLFSEYRSDCRYGYYHLKSDVLNVDSFKLLAKELAPYFYYLESSVHIFYAPHGFGGRLGKACPRGWYIVSDYSLTKCFSNQFDASIETTLYSKIQDSLVDYAFKNKHFFYWEIDKHFSIRSFSKNLAFNHYYSSVYLAQMFAKAFMANIFITGACSVFCNY